MEFVRCHIGHLPPGMAAAVERDLAGTACMALGAIASDGLAPVVTLSSRRHESRVARVLAGNGFVEETLVPPARATPERHAPDEGQAEEDLARSEAAALEKERATWTATALEHARQIEAAVRRERALLEAEQLSPESDAVFVLTGWMPDRERNHALARLAEVTGERMVIEFEAARGREDGGVPVLLNSPSALRPFQALVEAFGLPRYRELAPTLFVALTYPLLFGIMFGDVGHGAVLAAAGWAILRWGREGWRDLGWLPAAAGATSILFGLAYGSWFGLETMKQYALWQDPLEGDPAVIMAAAVGVGVAQLSLGVVLNILNRLAHRDLAGALLGKCGAAGLAVYWSALALILLPRSAVDRGFGWIPVGVAVAGVAGWVVAGLRVRGSATEAAAATPSLVAHLTEVAVDALEGVLVYFANTVSFVRLGAYALSHAALLTATFSVAAEIRASGVHGAALLSAAVIAGGNLVTLVLEGLVASIQALRLEYYEFFGKFFTGDGEPFRAFRLAAPAAVAHGLRSPAQPTA